MQEPTLTKTDNRAEAARLIAAGLRVWPVRDKRPVRAGFARKDGPDVCAEVHEFANADVAVLAGPCAFAGEAYRLVLLDLDGDVPESELPAWPATLTAKCGRHRWYRVARETKAWRQTARVRAGEGWAVDTRDFGGFGQETRDGSPLWDNFGAVEPAVLTDAQCAELFGAGGGLRAQATVLAKTSPPAIEGQNGSGALWNVALDLVRGLRLPVGEAHALLMAHYNPRCVPPWSEADVLRKCTEALEKGQVAMGYLAVLQPEGGYLLTEKGGVKACFENVVRYARVALGPELKWDEVAYAVHYRGRRADLDALVGETRCAINVAIGLDPSAANMQAALERVARERPFNRLKDELLALPKWDGRRRLDRWLVQALGAADATYERAVGRMWLISAIARAFRPGCKADCLLILEGGQGIGKSTALSIIGGATEGGYKDLAFHTKDKDAMQELRGAWVVEYSELTGLDKRDNDWLKGFIAKSTDTYRPSHGRTVQDFPRTCVLAGTVNPTGDGRYLRDEENRRYWPVACGASPATLATRLGWLSENRAQLLAEAKAMFEAGEAWWPEGDFGQRAAQEARREIDPLECSIPQVVGDDLEVDMRLLRADPRLARDLMGSPNWQGRQIGKVLRRLGFEPPRSNYTIWKRKRSE